MEFDAVINLSAPTFIAVLERSLTSPKWIGGLRDRTLASVARERWTGNPTKKSTSLFAMSRAGAFYSMPRRCRL